MRIRALLAVIAIVITLQVLIPTRSAAQHLSRHHYRRSRVGEERAEVVHVAKLELGRPYVYGAAGPRSFDCSGLVRFAYSKLGHWLPHNAAAQFSILRAAHGKMRPGDLLYFYGLQHVGMYVGKGRFIEASSSRGRVKLTTLDGWHRSAMDGVRRVFAS